MLKGLTKEIIINPKAVIFDTDKLNEFQPNFVKQEKFQNLVNNIHVLRYINPIQNLTLELHQISQ